MRDLRLRRMGGDADRLRAGAAAAAASKRIATGAASSTARSRGATSCRNGATQLLFAVWKSAAVGPRVLHGLRDPSRGLT